MRNGSMGSIAYIQCFLSIQECGTMRSATGQLVVGIKRSGERYWNTVSMIRGIQGTRHRMTRR